MTPRTWALKKAEKFVVNDNIQGPIVAFFRAAGLVESEHARAVRVVKALKKAIQTPICDVDHGYILACDDILAALQRGRGKGGK